VELLLFTSTHHGVEWHHLPLNDYQNHTKKRRGKLGRESTDRQRSVVRDCVVCCVYSLQLGLWLNASLQVGLQLPGILVEVPDSLR
jgi:hypothetical protein